MKRVEGVRKSHEQRMVAMVFVFKIASRPLPSKMEQPPTMSPLAGLGIGWGWSSERGNGVRQDIEALWTSFGRSRHQGLGGAGIIDNVEIGNNPRRNGTEKGIAARKMLMKPWG